MALYKRYIPPKPGAASGSAPQVASVPTPAPPTKAPPKPTQHEQPQKRKRERTDEEVAERKAKKLRNKGMDPATVDRSTKSTEQQAAGRSPEKDATTQAIGVANSASDGPAASAPGDFSHIKDKKKRHKLEKEARKARIAAEKEAKADDVHAGKDEEAPADGVVDEAQTDELPQTAGAEEDAAPPLKRKKRRKDRLHDSADTDAVESPTEGGKTNGDGEQVFDAAEGQGAVNGSHVDASQYDPSRSQPKKRRHKLEAVLTESNEDIRPADEEETHHLKKHGNIIDKFQKSQNLVENIASIRGEEEGRAQAPEVVLRDLVPLPQPEKAPTPEFRPDPNALPLWLAKPTIIADGTKSTFAELGLEARLVQHLSKLGFDNALPVQQALIPLLLAPGTAGARYLPGTESVVPDIAVGAPTGSGKTIAYLLPIIEALKKLAGSGKLKVLIVVPTRELVMQVAAVAESLARGSRVKVGVATGTGSFSDEQSRLIKRERRHDAERYRKLMTKARRIIQPPLEHVDEDLDDQTSAEQRHEDFEAYLDEIEGLDAKEQQHIRDTVSELTDHIPTYHYAVDILVATPGRLVEHIDNTLGLNLAHLEWLVLDEADKLLDGQYSNFLQVITSELHRPHSEEEQDARERYLRAKSRWQEGVERRVRKVVLSATMTRDISKLMDLRLRRPQMVLVRGKDQAEQQIDGQVEMAEDSFELPPTLREYSVHVGDGSEKPLFLLQVLREHIVPGPDAAQRSAKPKLSVSGDSDTDSSSDSSASEDLSDSSSDASSVSDSDNETDAANGEDDTVVSASANHAIIHPTRASALDHEPTAPTVLIFTSSTESASRLSHLLPTLLPPNNRTPSILTLTSTTTSKALTKQLSTIPSSQAVLATTTDRAARGLDALGSRSVTHVVQYDVPRSATNYVHRVGRTARAGRAGEAWTLFTHSEAKWFVDEVMRGGVLRRGGGNGVAKVKVRVEDEGSRERFREAVEGLRGDVLGGTYERKEKNGVARHVNVI